MAAAAGFFHRSPVAIKGVALGRSLTPQFLDQRSSELFRHRLGSPKGLLQWSRWYLESNFINAGIVYHYQWLSMIINDCQWLSMIVNDCQWLSTIHWSSMILATVSAPPWALAACIAPSRLPQRTPRLWRPPLGSRRTRTRHRAWKPKAPAKSLPLRTYITYILGNAVSST